MRSLGYLDIYTSLSLSLLIREGDAPLQNKANNAGTRMVVGFLKETGLSALWIGIALGGQGGKYTNLSTLMPTMFIHRPLRLPPKLDVVGLDRFRW